MLLYVHNADEYSVQLKKKADVAKTSGLYEPKSILASVGKLRQSKHVPRSRNRWTSDHVIIDRLYLDNIHSPINVLAYADYECGCWPKCYIWGEH